MTHSKMTTPVDGKRNHNLQVQVNKQATITSLKKLAPSTVSTALVPEVPASTPAVIRAELLANVQI